jgi:hypothetical protein
VEAIKTWLLNVFKGNLTMTSLASFLLCLAARKYMNLAVPDEVMAALGAAVIAGLSRTQHRIEAVVNEQVAPTGPPPGADPLPRRLDASEKHGPKEY